MSPRRVLVIYLVVVFGGAALLAPWFYELGHWATARSPYLAGLARHPFHRYVSRLMLILAVAGLWPLLRVAGIRSWSQVGLSRRPDAWRRLAVGFGIGGAIVLAAGLPSVVLGVRSLAPPAGLGTVLRHLFNAGGAALLVSPLEELVFRGAVLGILQREGRRWSALILSSLIYATVHFLGRPEPPGKLTWYAGFTVLTGMLGGPGDAQPLLPLALVNLTLLGLILGFWFQHTGSLSLSMGIHAGCIFWLKSFRFLTQDGPAVNPWLWGSGKLVDGGGVLLCLAVTFLIGVGWRARSQRGIPGPKLSAPSQ